MMNESSCAAVTSQLTFYCSVSDCQTAGQTRNYCSTEITHLFEEGCGEVASFDGHISQHPLLVGFLQNVLLHRSLADQPEEQHDDGVSLSAPTSSHDLHYANTCTCRCGRLGSGRCGGSGPEPARPWLDSSRCRRTPPCQRQSS